MIGLSDRVSRMVAETSKQQRIAAHAQSCVHHGVALECRDPPFVVPSACSAPPPCSDPLFPPLAIQNRAPTRGGRRQHKQAAMSVPNSSPATATASRTLVITVAANATLHASSSATSAVGASADARRLASLKKGLLTWEAMIQRTHKRPPNTEDRKKDQAIGQKKQRAPAQAEPEPAHQHTSARTLRDDHSLMVLLLCVFNNSCGLR